jgi:hypothetical protein
MPGDRSRADERVQAARVWAASFVYGCGMIVFVSDARGDDV